MRVLLDECLPRRLKRELVGHDVRTVPESGWAGKSNGELLLLMAGAIDVFVTIDRGMLFQQTLADRTFAVIVLRAHSNRLADLQPLVPQILQALDTVRRGKVVRIGG